MSVSENKSSKSGTNVRETLSLYAMLAAATHDKYEPKSYREAMNECPDRDRWRSAMKSEYDSLMSNNTWQLCALQAGRKAIDSLWIYKVKLKRDATGTFDRYKTR